MGLQPIIEKKTTTNAKKCAWCGLMRPPDEFAPTSGRFFADGIIPVCDTCIDMELRVNEYNWATADKLCQWADIPFVPREWENLRQMSEKGLFHRYATIFQASDYEGIGWGDYFQAFRELEASGQIEAELPGLAEDRRRHLRERWGGSYDDEALLYLENLYNGLMTTQNINGALQRDQALKICKMSYEVDRRIEEGSDFDKLLASYDKLVKAAEFTPKNVKNINDFDTCGELVKWLERSGWVNQYYDNVPRDIVDETIANIQAYNQRLYTNESGIGEEITRRLASLRMAEQLEQGTYYSTGTEIEDLDRYEVDGYDRLLKDEDFVIDLDEEEGD